MKRHMLLSLVPLALALTAGAQEPPPAEAPAAEHPDRVFAAAIEACTAATHQGKHPFVASFTIEHRIDGEVDGACAYQQTMPGGMRMECKLTDEGRAGLAEEFRRLADGKMSGSTGQQPAWTRDCEIVTKDGKRSPMQSG